MKTSVVEVYNLPRVSYDDGLDLQRKLIRDVQDGLRPNTLIFLEHTPVITLGRGWREDNVLKSRKWLTDNGVEVRETNRGGDVTYHGPGQLVGYPIVNLAERGKDLRKYLTDLEHTIILGLKDFGVTATSGDNPTGVWVNGSKIAAIGIAVQRWVASHGFALNVNSDLTAFDLIVPCGLRGREVTSLERETGTQHDIREVANSVARAFGDRFDASVTIKGELNY